MEDGGGGDEPLMSSRHCQASDRKTPPLSSSGNAGTTVGENAGVDGQNISYGQKYDSATKFSGQASSVFHLKVPDEGLVDGCALIESNMPMLWLDADYSMFVIL
jgi:hypothetical protein